MHLGDGVGAVVDENIVTMRRTLADALAEWIDHRAARTGADRDAVEAAVLDAVVACAQGYITRLALDRTVDPAALRSSLAALVDGG